MTAAPDSPVCIGEVLAGKYRVGRVLGAGAMGVVVAATHVHLNEPVAVKLLHPQAPARKEVLARFFQEARIAVKIKSEHVARVIDLGVLDSGLPYMAMELLRGQDLAAVLSQRGPLSVPEAVEYVLQACEAIGEAHTLGMVHRDLKPANMFLTKRADGSPLVKVLDFGISKASDLAPAPSAGAASLTATGAVMGSPAYMSPEQIRDAKAVDHRSDIWAVGMILYELLTGRVAFDATTVTGLLAKIVADPPIPLASLRPDIPPVLAAVVASCLMKDPSSRPQTIGELALQLGPVAPPSARPSVERIGRLFAAATPSDPAGFVATVAAVVPGTAPPSTTAGWSATSRGEPRPRSSLRSVAIAIPVVVVLGGAALGLAHYLPGRSRHEPPPVAAHAAAPGAAVSSAPVAPDPPTPVATATAAVASEAAGSSAPPVPNETARAASSAVTRPLGRKPPSSLSKTPTPTTGGELGGAIDSRR